MSEALQDRPWYGDWPDNVPKHLEIPTISLGDILRDTARKYPDDKATVFLDTIVTYRQLDDYVDRLATALHQLGLRKGDVVALMLPNSHQFVVAFYACQRLGIVVTAINPTYKPLEVRHQLNDSGARALIVLDAIWEVAGQAVSGTKVQHVIGTNVVDLCGFSPVKRLLGKLLKKIPTGALPATALRFKDLLRTAPAVPQVSLDPANDLAVLQYTGGTTGTPKGAVLTARNLVANALAGKAWIGQDFPRAAGWVGVLPLFHIFAMTCVMNISVTTGGFMLLFPRPPADLKDLARAIERWGKGTQLCLPGVAALFNRLNTTPGITDFDLSPLKRALSGAGPLPRDVQMKFEEMSGALVVEGYGLSESSPVVTANPFVTKPGRERVLGSIGLPFPDTDLEIRDLETGKTKLPYGPDHVGEICVKGPQVMKGYYNKPEETAHALRDGWLYTGDLGYMDERGWTFVKDRAKDLVKHKGYSVFPKEIEEYLFAHPAILEAAVIGLPHKEHGEVLKAFVVLRPEHAATTAEAIISWCKENMAHYKVPGAVEFRTELPKTLVGKVLRRVLKEEEQAKRDGLK